MMAVLLRLLLLVCVPSLADATTYYVSTSGNNSNSCATAQSSGASAKRTLEGASGGAACLAAGDTLIVQAGTYAMAYPGLANTGTPVIASGTDDNSHTTIQCETSRACTLTSVGWAFRFYGSADHHITVKDFILSADSVVVALNSPDTTYANSPHHIRIENNEIKDSSLWCVTTGYGVSNVFTKNTIHNCGEQGVYGGLVSSTFTYNEVYGNGTTSVANKRQAMQIQTSGGLQPSNSVVMGNYFHDNPDDCLIIANATTLTIQRNVFDTCAWGLRVLGSGSNMTNSFVDQNTFYGNTLAGLYIPTGSTGNVCRNNAAVGNTTNISLAAGTCTETDNLTTGTATDIWNSPSTGDFRLKSGSVAIDGGTDIGLTFNGSAPDQGAFETFSFSTCSVESGDASTVRLTFTNNVNPPLLPASSGTGFTARKNAASNVVTAVTRTGDNRIDLTTTDSYAGGDTVDVSYSSGNLTDSALVGNTYNQQYLATLTNQSCTNNVTGGGGATLTQTHARIHGLRGAEAAPIVKASTDTNYSIVQGGKARVRLKVACTGADCAALGMALRYSKNSGAYTVVPDTFGADNIQFIGTTTEGDVPTNGTTTTEQLTSDHATNVACALVRTSSAIPTVDLSQNSETECEYAIQLDSDVTVGDTYDFRLYDQGGTALGAYTVTPRLTVIGMQAGGGP